MTRTTKLPMLKRALELKRAGAQARVCARLGYSLPVALLGFASTIAHAAPTLPEHLPATLPQALTTLGLSTGASDNAVSLYLIGALGLALLSFGVAAMGFRAARRAPGPQAGAGARSRHRPY